MNIQLKSIAVTMALLVAPMMSTTALADDTVLTDKAGMTLYTFDKDAKGVSNCNGACANNWPPFIMKEGANVTKGFGFIVRENGAKQWTYNDKPLYTWVGDKKKGDTTGNGVGGVWHTAIQTSSMY